jgi:hypothetical protein
MDTIATAASFIPGGALAVDGIEAAETGAAIGEGLAAQGSSVLDAANFAQKTYSEAFSAEGSFAGRTIDDVAGALKSGEMTADQVPVSYINREGNTLILNTRSSQALERAGIPRSQWNAVDMTGDAAAESRLTNQLTRNGLLNTGTPVVRSSGR